jgi:hypothetical protein
MPTKQSGLGDNFYVNGYDLSGDLSSVDTISSPMSPIEVTALNQFAHQRVAGLRDGAISFTSFFDMTGTTTTPSVPATTVPATSTYPWPVQVTVIGGTITHITINGVESYAPVAPAVPGTEIAVTNTTGAIVNVTISGGTMSAVFVGGFQVGTGAGVYPVRPGQQIFLVYTVAPTWTWASFGATYTLPAFGTIIMTFSVAPTWNWFVMAGEHTALAIIPSADQVCTYNRGSLVGNPSCCMVSKQTDYNPTRDASANLTVKVDWMANGYGLEWGVQLTNGLRTDIAATTGPSYDQGGTALAFGCQAYLQIVEFVGTSCDILITHATTSGGTYTTLVDFATLVGGGNFTAVGAYRVALSNTTTVNEFLKVATTGTFSYLTFAVTFVRNQFAGQQF